MSWNPRNAIVNVQKMIETDAANWARAEMFFGEGAGTRRKLLQAEISEKIKMIPGYKEAFDSAYAKQNMADHAIRAAKERKNIDRSIKVSRNAKALMRGDRRSLTGGVLVVVYVGYYAHRFGYDKVALDKGKKYYRKIKADIKSRNIRRDFDRVVSDINVKRNNNA